MRSCFWLRKISETAVLYFLCQVKCFSIKGSLISNRLRIEHFMLFIINQSFRERSLENSEKKQKWSSNKQKTQQLSKSWKRLQQSSSSPILILQMTKLKAREVNGRLGSQVINQTFLTLSTVLSTSFQEYLLFPLTEFFLILHSFS